LPYRLTALPPYRLTALPPYRLTALPPYRHAAGMSVIALMTTHRRQQLAAAGVCAESLAAVKVRVVSQVGRRPGSLKLSVTEMSDHESA